MSRIENEMMRQQKLIQYKIREVNAFIDHLKSKKKGVEERLSAIDEAARDWKGLNHELQETERKLLEAYSELSFLEDGDV